MATIEYKGIKIFIFQIRIIYMTNWKFQNIDISICVEM